MGKAATQNLQSALYQLKQKTTFLDLVPKYESTKKSHLKWKDFLVKTAVIIVTLTTLEMINDFESPQARFSKIFSS